MGKPEDFSIRNCLLFQFKIQKFKYLRIVRSLGKWNIVAKSTVRFWLPLFYIIMKVLGTFIDFVLAIYNTNDYAQSDEEIIYARNPSMAPSSAGNFSTEDVDVSSLTDIAVSQTGGILGTYLPTIFGRRTCIEPKITYDKENQLFITYMSRTLSRQPADESTEYFTKYCINQIEIAYVVIFGTTLIVGIASTFYIARFKSEMIALIISIPNFRADFISYLNNDGLLSQDITRSSDTEKAERNSEEIGIVEQDYEQYNVVEQDYGSEQMTTAEINSWSDLQKYKSRCNDYYWNDDADYNKALPMALAMPKPSMHD